MEATEEIRGNCTVRHDSANGSNTLEVPLTRIVTLHQLQDTVIPGLCRQMDMLTDIRILRHRANSFVIHILGVRGGKTDTHTRYRKCHSLQQVSKVINSITIHEAIRIHVLPQQRYLSVALAG